MVVKVVLFIIEKGEEALSILGDAIDVVVDFVENLNADADAAEAFAKKIKAKPEILFFAPPEAKGAILYRLSETFTFSFEEHQEAAILTVMGTMQTQKEWDKVVSRITKDGSKTSKAAGLARLNWVLDGGSQKRFNQALLEINTLPTDSNLIVGVPVDRSLMGIAPIVSRLA